VFVTAGDNVKATACALVLLACIAIGGPVASHAQTLETTPTEVRPAPSAGPEITDYSLPPDLLAKSEALYRTRVAMYSVGAIYGLLVLLAFLATRFAPRVRDLCERVSRRRPLQVLLFGALLLLAIDVCHLPLSVYGQHVQRSYGLSVQGWPSWSWDWVKGELVSMAVGAPLVWGFYAFLRRSPTRWWLYGWLACLPVIVFFAFAEPVLIAPLFNKFDSLEATQPQLVPEIEKVIHRGGLDIDRSRMFEMQASDKVTTYNAYVTGIGASKRVVVWDNTVRDMSIPEILFVFGHEQGHYVLHHIWELLAFASLGLLVALYLGSRIIGRLLARFGQRWGVRSLDDLASLPALLLVLGVFSFVSLPIGSAFSRHLEHQADIYGLEVTHDLVPDSPQVAARAFQKLGEKALSYPDPNPIFAFWAYDHPPIRERVKFALGYRPWERGEATRYVGPIAK
jgi:Zn-dependent protease with chaperone function